MKCAKTNGQDDGLIFKMVLPEMMRYIYNVKKKKRCDKHDSTSSGYDVQH